jgi:hypothetical protein
VVPSTEAHTEMRFVHLTDKERKRAEPTHEGFLNLLRLAKNNWTHVTTLRCMLLAVYFVLSLLNVYLSSTLTMVDHKTLHTQLPHEENDTLLGSLELLESAGLAGLTRASLKFL